MKNELQKKMIFSSTTKTVQKPPRYFCIVSNQIDTHLKIRSRFLTRHNIIILLFHLLIGFRSHHLFCYLFFSLKSIKTNTNLSMLNYTSIYTLSITQTYIHYTSSCLSTIFWGHNGSQTGW